MPLGRLTADGPAGVVYLNFSVGSQVGQALTLTPQVAVPAGLYALVPVDGAPPVVEVTAVTPATGAAPADAGDQGGASNASKPAPAWSARQ